MHAICTQAIQIVECGPRKKYGEAGAYSVGDGESRRPAEKPLGVGEGERKGPTTGLEPRHYWW